MRDELCARSFRIHHRDRKDAFIEHQYVIEDVPQASRTALQALRIVALALRGARAGEGLHMNIQTLALGAHGAMGVGGQHGHLQLFGKPGDKGTHAFGHDAVLRDSSVVIQ